MKFGFRTPSFKRSLSAATKGAAKRALMREIVPYYGKRGMGWSNPKKAAYNRVYNMTTASPIDIITDKSKGSKAITETPITQKTAPYTKPQPKKDLQTWEVVLRCIGAIVAFGLIIWLVLWLISEFVFPALLLGLIFLSFLFSSK